MERERWCVWPHRRSLLPVFACSLPICYARIKLFSKKKFCKLPSAVSPHGPFMVAGRYIGNDPEALFPKACLLYTSDAADD